MLAVSYEVAVEQQLLQPSTLEGCAPELVRFSVLFRKSRLPAQGQRSQGAPQETVENRRNHRHACGCSTDALGDGCGDVLSCSLETHQFPQPSFSKTDGLNGGGEACRCSWPQP